LARGKGGPKKAWGEKPKKSTHRRSKGEKGALFFLGEKLVRPRPLNGTQKALEKKKRKGSRENTWAGEDWFNSKLDWGKRRMLGKNRRPRRGG